jgi:hypothetical protein
LFSGTHAPRDAVAKTPLFLEHPVIGCDNGLEGRFRPRSGLAGLGEKRDRLSETSGDLERVSQIRN